jgi:DNA-directed RNA polymerase subunit E"
MGKEKACRTCRIIYEGAKCPSCGGSDGMDSFKGRVNVLDVDKSEIARELGITKKGSFAIRLR